MLDWCVAHPLLSFALAWPTGLTLVSLVWAVTNLITTMSAQLLAFVTQTAALGLALVRGYPPAPVLPPVVEETDDLS